MSSNESINSKRGAVTDMSARRIRQLIRLEEKLQPDIRRAARRKAKEHFELYMAAGHSAIIAFLTRYGAPRIEEPLWRACKRVENSEAWGECCQMFPVASEQIGYRFRPYRNLLELLMPLRHGLIRFFPGRDERDKISRVFEIAPPWLLWFTYADHSARKLGVRLPDLSSVTYFQRRKICSDEYPENKYIIPEGTVERRPWPDGVIREPVARVKIVDRADWPILLPKERIEHLREETLEVFHASDPLAAMRAIWARK